MYTTNHKKSPFDGIKRATDERNVQLSQETGKFSQTNSTKIRIGNQTIGAVENGVFEKHVHSSKHFLRKPRAIALDQDSLIQAKNLGARIVKIVDLDTGIIYIVTIDLFYEKGFRFNRGFGDQIGLTLDHWECKYTEPINQQQGQSFPFPSQKKRPVKSGNSIDRENQPYLFA